MSQWGYIFQNLLIILFKSHLFASQVKLSFVFFQLQVPDELLSLLMSMGYKQNDAKRALRMSGQNVESAVDLLVDLKEKKMRKREDDRRRQREIM